jgi:hypothetical protein
MTEAGKIFIYKIGGKKYTQRKLVFAQLRQLNRAIKGIQFPIMPDPNNPSGPPLVSLALADWVDALGPKIIEVLGVALSPEGVELKDKDPVALAAELDWAIDGETVMQAAEDFFACNPRSLFEAMLERAELLLKGLLGAGKKTGTGSAPISPSLRKETPSGPGKSSGPAHPMKPSPAPAG